MRYFLALVLSLALGLQTSPNFAATPTASDSDVIFRYVEAAYPQFVSPSGAASQTADIYYYRYYPGTKAYIATANGRFYYLGPASNNQIVDLGASADWLSTSMGLLAGSVIFPGPYPRSGAVTYTNTSNGSVTVRAYPGQVMVHFNVLSGGTSSAALSQREDSIRKNGGAVIQEIPLLGFYLAQVPTGQENRFIQAMRAGGFGVILALPNMAQSARASTPVTIDDSCWIGVGTCTVPKYFPLNVGEGVVILDHGVHGDYVYQTANAAGGTVSAVVTLPIIEEDGEIFVPNDRAAATIAAVINGAAMFSPGKRVIANYSWGATAACENDATIPCGNDPDYPKYWEDEAALFDATIKATMDQLPESQRDNFMLVQALGNAGQDISDAFGRTYAAQLASGMSRNHLYVGATDSDSNSTQVGDPNYHGKIAWYRGCIAPGICGSSFAAPAVAAFIDQTARRSSVSLDQSATAVEQTLTATPAGTPTEIVTAAETSITGRSDLTIAISSASCVNTKYVSYADIWSVKVSASGNASGPVGTRITMGYVLKCSAWANCIRQPGEPATTNWTETFGFLSYDKPLSVYGFKIGLERYVYDPSYEKQTANKAMSLDCPVQ